MEPYQGASSGSGVESYEIGPDFIRIRFHEGRTYVYTYETAGQIHVTRMKQLARAGKGLSTYISKYVRDAYASEEP